MKAEQAIDILTEFSLPSSDDLKQAVAVAIQSLTANIKQLRNDPLTVEELRTMAGQPYWHESLQGNRNQWSILDPHFCKYPESYNYGNDWVAYRWEKKE